MAIVLDHTIVPARDKEASARFFAQMFGLSYDGSKGHFAPVRVNEALTFDFDNRDEFEHHHYAFHISDQEFDAILERVKAAGRTCAAGRAATRTARSTPDAAAGASTSPTSTGTCSK